MGTISDKLMRIINTKEDIRQALISKGYDVPTSIPFKEYAKMILDLPCKVDSFPDIEGIVARYSASGLTNEQMAANPVWVDKTGNGHDLQMKNFFWGGMSGVNGYVQNFNYFRNNATVDKVRIDEQSSNSIKVTLLTSGISYAIYIPKDIYQFNKSYFIKISSEGYNEGDLFLSFYVPSTSTATTVKVPLNPNGITEIPAIKEDDFLAVYLFNAAGKVGSITIEQLPLYPGALVFDGVDDYGVCDNFPILTKEKGYTVVALRQWITYNPNAISAIATNASDQSFNGAFTFENYNKGAEQTISYGATQITLQYSKSPFSWQTTSKYNGVNIANGNKDATNSLVLGRSYPQRNEFANFAIWELVFLDHDATEEELTKIKDYFVKTYPWLFPDQAWTVTGKTNEDTDRATITNITGNGNDLVLSNFGFAEGSGYGLYANDFTIFSTNPSTIPVDKTNSKISVNTTINSSTWVAYINNVEINPMRVEIKGKNDKDEMVYRHYSLKENKINEIALSNGIHSLPKSGINPAGGTNWCGFLIRRSTSSNITIEQIPEYEGYLVTDGVDDKAVSKQFKFGKNFTVILDFKFPVKKISYCGFDLSSKVRIQNLQGRGVYVVLKGNKTLIPSNVVRAVTSEGKVYDENWNEYNIVPGNVSSNYTMVNLGFDGSNQFAESATKLAGIYSSTLSKDDCIKAYNYLQTLKAK